ncbi:EndoU domain-containing protein [Phormidium nigroviride]
MIEQDGLIARVPRIRIEPSKLKSYLSNFRMRQIRLGSRTITLGRNNFRHILEQHHPRFMNLSHVKDTQTFFDENMDPDEILDLIETIIKQNRNVFRELPEKLPREGIEIIGVVNGVKYNLVVDHEWRIKTFYPLK